jgi:hypothetical protein
MNRDGFNKLFDEHFIDECDEVYDAQNEIVEYAEKAVKLFAIPDVSQQSELFFAVLKWAKQADLDYPDYMLQKDFEQFTAKNCG